ncbi:MAG: hypothetical protein WC701_10860 [Kiritimatiellales bacterium]|jgi:hypothetical protein
MPPVRSIPTALHRKWRSVSWKIRIAELSSGYLIWNVLDYIFDYVLYPFVIYKWGPLAGGIGMTLLSLLSCLMLIWIYDWMGRDWLGIETVKGLKIYAGASRWRQWLARMLRKSDGIAFLVLSLKYDPFITTAYLRRSAFNGMTRRDWMIFFSSGLLANLWWITACFGGVSVLTWLRAKL